LLRPALDLGTPRRQHRVAGRRGARSNRRRVLRAAYSGARAGVLDPEHVARRLDNGLPARAAAQVRTQGGLDVGSGGMAHHRPGGEPSTRTVQHPHWPWGLQPSLTERQPSSSRKASSSEIPPATATASPLRVNATSRAATPAMPAPSTPAPSAPGRVTALWE